MTIDHWLYNRVALTPRAVRLPQMRSSAVGFVLYIVLTPHEVHLN